MPFLWRRARRLYPPLLAAVVITWGADALGSRLGYPIYAARTPYPLFNTVIGHDHSPLTLAGNLAFVMGQYVPVWGTDSPLWSLKYEWWFYVLYPLLWPLLRRSPWPATAVVAGAYVLAVAGPAKIWPVALLREVVVALPIWWLGALLAEVYAGRIGVPFVRLVPLVVFLPVAAGVSTTSRWQADELWGLGFAGLIAAGMAWEQRSRSLSGLDFLRPMGDFSYTLYVIHAPLLVLASGWLMSRSPTGELPASFLPALIVAVGTLPLAYLLHFAVERPFVGHRRPSRKVDGPTVDIAISGPVAS